MPKDKQLHILAGLALSLLTGFFSTPLLGLVTAVTMGVGKEIVWDLILGRGTPELLDAWATIVGGAIGLAILEGISLLS